jgi:hypothetical protein
MNQDLQDEARKIAVANITSACSDMIRYQNGLAITDDSVLHTIYGLCLNTLSVDDPMEEAFKIVSQAAVCAMAGSKVESYETTLQKVKTGFQKAVSA